MISSKILGVLELSNYKINWEVLEMNAWLDDISNPEGYNLNSMLKRIKEAYDKYLKGTTTIGITCTDGVVLATDRRVTSGYYIAHKRGKKIYIIDKHVAATVAGVVADAQKLVDQLSAEARLYRIENNRPMNVKAIATLASNILLRARPSILIVQILLGGVDESEGATLYNIDWFGTITKEKFTATGSGYSVAIGVLEEGYHDGITVNEAIPLAIRAVHSAMLRDTGSGEGIDVAVITKEGCKLLSDNEVKRYLSK